MSSARLPTRLRRRAAARTHFGWARSERATAALAAVSLGGAGIVLAGQFGRMLRRRAHERADSDGLAEAAPAAAIDTVNIAVSGYAAAPRSETVLFNLLAGFLGSFALVRLSTWGIRERWWPFRNVRLGGRHIHHFVPGILIAFASGTTALLTRDEALEERLAVTTVSAWASPSTRPPCCSTCATSTGRARGCSASSSASAPPRSSASPSSPSGSCAAASGGRRPRG